MISADDVSNQIQFGTMPADWTVFQPPKYPWIVLALYGFCYVALWPLILTVIYGFVFWLWLDPKLVQSSFWPMYTTYPILAVIAVAFPFFLIWLVWRLEKRDRDTLFVLLPQGCVQYKPWKSESKRQAKVIEYARTEEIVAQKKLAGIVISIRENDGKQETLFLTRKYGGISLDTTVHEDIARRMVDAWRSWNEDILPEEDNHPGNQQPAHHEWLHEGKLSRRRLLQISGGVAIAGSVASVGVMVAELIHWDSRTLFVDQGHTNAVHFVAWSPDGTRLASASCDGTAKIWDALNGNALVVYTDPEKASVNNLAWSPDNRLVALACSTKLVHIWDSSTGKIIQTYTGHTEPVFAVAWSPDGKRIISGSMDTTVQVWQATNGLGFGISF